MKFKNINISICQLEVLDDKDLNLQKAKNFIKKAADQGANIVVLPAMFNCPYRTSKFRIFAEEESNSKTIDTISSLAKENQIYIVAGSIPEKEGEKYYNTSYVFDEDGNMIAKHRKIHLYDVDIKNKLKIKESDVFSPGQNITVFDTKYGKIGLLISYDIRFPEIFRIMTDMGADIIIAPSAFYEETGKKHWDNLIKVRSMDNQVFVVAVSPARKKDEKYIVYGHSKIVDPYGKILCELDENEGIKTCNVNIEYLSELRKEFPILEHRRLDLYNVIKKDL
ncbi:MAG: carbon-nitrogen hydrolase family protein [Peptostreptococcaceae bacterium]|jgi:predicted amidohydrolase|nr:carbon-nitrogen hydrolase family protein [Peptostreptococcaceae bacterium]